MLGRITESRSNLLKILVSKYHASTPEEKSLTVIRVGLLA